MRPYIEVVEYDAQTGLYVGHVPGLCGAHSQGESIEELLANLAEVVAMLSDDGEALVEGCSAFTAADLEEANEILQGVESDPDEDLGDDFVMPGSSPNIRPR